MDDPSATGSRLTRRRAIAGMASGGALLASGVLAATSEEPGPAPHTTARMPTAFIPHGGGPWPVLRLPPLPESETVPLADYMRSIAEAPARKPRALLVISAHWEERTLTVNTNPAPPMYFDYYNFPPEAYRFSWPAPGDPELAVEVRDLLRDAGFDTVFEPERGYDHGTFIPLMLAYPEADIPVVQLSLRQGLDPTEHLRIGRALASLRDRGIYILGSGNSFHNLRAILRGGSELVPASQAFDSWLAETITAPQASRDERLEAWSEAPSARASHPREEHLLPLMVIAGAAGDDAGEVVWHGTMNAFAISAHQFG